VAKTADHDPPYGPANTGLGAVFLVSAFIVLSAGGFALKLLRLPPI